MPICSKCKIKINEADSRIHYEKILCDDCFIDRIMPKIPKAHYNNDAEFMNRLKDSYSVRKQKYH